MKPRWPRYTAAALGVMWYFQLGGWHTLNPLNLQWLMSGDWRQHLLGWLFFRREPWTFPLGTLTALPYPVGSTIGFTDSNPLVSILLKPFAGWLPDEFQFIGPWLALCFAMQGYWGARLAGIITKEPVQQLLGGYLFVLSPVLAARLGHDTLCAQWLLLAFMYVGLRDYTDAQDVRRHSRLAVVLAAMSAAIHPYLAAMSATMAFACYLRLWRGRLVSFRRAVVLVAMTMAAMYAVMASVGYFTDAQPGSVGFETYAADLVTLIDPVDYSRLLPNFHLMDGRWEGFGFLGLGVLLALIAAPIAWMLARRDRAVNPAAPASTRGVWIIALVCLLMGVYALSAKVTLVNDQVARLHHIYDSLDILTKPFRSSGRFIWALHYLLTFVALWGVIRLFGRRAPAAATAALAIVIAVQAADYRAQDTILATKKFRQVNDLGPAKGRFHHMAIYPAQILGACGGPYEEDHVYRYMLAAYRLNMTFNSGIFARIPLDRVQRSCGDFYRSVDAGRLDPDTLYVASPWTVAHLKEIGAACGRFDGDWICVARDADPAYRTFIETGVLPK